MFRKLHIQMTLFATLITGSILLVMTLVCILISEKSTRENSFAAFSTNAASCVFHMESQSLLSHRWMMQAQNSYGFYMKIKDQGKPLFYDRLHPAESTDEPFEKAAEISRNTQGIDPDYTGKSSPLTKTALFKMKGFYVCTVLIPKGEGSLSAVILYPLTDLNRRISATRLVFALTAFAAFSALAVFSWFFTKKMIQPLEKSRRRQTEFIAAASHELRSPLAVILSSVQAMDCTVPSEVHRFSSIILAEGNRMTRLIGDMLSLANADNQSWSIHPVPCELDTLLLGTYETYEPLMLEKNLRFRISLPEDILPACKCDPSRITQILSILLDNAISCVPSGGTIQLSLSMDANGFHLIISDNGPGIPEKDRESIFQRFYRADISRRDKQHFGLGLSIAQEIALLHHGRLTVSETPGGGATFTLTLPK